MLGCCNNDEPLQEDVPICDSSVTGCRSNRKKRFWIIFGLLLLIIFSIFVNFQEKYSLWSTVNTEILELGTYTPATYEAYSEALELAESIKWNPYVSEADLVHTTERLQKAINSLEPKPDKTALQESFELAIAVDTDKYIPKSLVTLQTAISNASSILNDVNATR